MREHKPKPARVAGLLLLVLLPVLLLAACGDAGGGDALSRAQKDFELRNGAAAVVSVKAYLQSNPSSGPARHLFGLALLQSGDAAGAEVELNRALELDHPADETVPPLARAMLVQRKYAALLLQYGKVQLDDRAASDDLASSLAQALAATGSAAEARERLQQVLARDPGSVPALMALARVKSAAGDIEGAIATLDDLLQRSPGQTDAWQLKGDALVRGKRDVEGALKAYRSALALEPKNATLHSAVITMHFVRQDGAAAAQQFEAMKREAPNHALTRYHEAQYTFERGDAKKAAELLQPILVALPDRANVWYLAGGVDAKRGALVQAEAHLTKALALQPGFVAARRLLADVHLLNHQPGKALAVLRAAADQPDADVETLALAGRAALLASEAKRSDAYFARAAKLGAGSARARTELALSDLAKGSSDIALAKLQAIAGTDPGVTADMALISARLQRGQFDAALKAIAGLDKKQATSPVGPELRARVQLARRDSAGARKSYEEALSRQPTYLPAVAGLAALDFTESKPDAARDRFLDLIKLDPRNAQAYLSLADLEARSGAPNEAIVKRINEAIAVAPSDAEARLALIEHHGRRGDAKAVLETAQASVAALPDNAALQDRLGRALLAAGETNQAEATFARLAAQHGQLATGPLGQADVALLKKDHDVAARHAKRALDLEPMSLPAHRMSIIVALRQGRKDVAVTMARAMQSSWPDEGLGFIIEGEIQAEQGRWDAAAAAFKSASKLDNPAQAPARLHAALTSGGQSAEAVRFAKGWLAEHPKDSLFQLYLAQTSERKSDFANAERHFRQVLVLEPDNVLALNNLASVLLKQDKPGALELANRAVKTAPNMLPLQDTLAMAMAQAKDHSKAIELQRKVVAAAPSVPVYRLTLARIYLMAGDRPAARSELEALSRIEKPFAERDEAADLLKRMGS